MTSRRSRRPPDFLLAGEDPAERDRRELELRMTLGPGLMALQFSAERVGDNFARAEALCERFDDAGELTIPLLGLIVFHHVRAEYEESCRLLERLSRLVGPLGDPTLLLRVHNDFGVNLSEGFDRPDLQRARAALDLRT